MMIIMIYSLCLLFFYSKLHCVIYISPIHHTPLPPHHIYIHASFNHSQNHKNNQMLSFHFFPEKQSSQGGGLVHNKPSIGV